MMTSENLPAEVLNIYLERRKADLEICRKAVSEKDFAVLLRVGHQIKGNAVSFGFNELEPIAIDLENYAIDKKIPEIESVLLRFENFLMKHPIQ